MEKLSIKEVSSTLGETADVIRNWVKDYKGFIPIEKAENGYNLYSPEAVEVLRTIQNLKRKQNYSARQIAHYLATGGDLVAAAAEPIAVAQQNEIVELKEMVAQLLEEQKKQTEFNRVLIERLDQRDQLTTQFLTERREQQLPQTKPSLLSKIFRKR